jgi:hypothetical protein
MTTTDVLTGGTYVNYYGGDGNDILYGNDQPKMKDGDFIL